MHRLDFPGGFFGRALFLLALLPTATLAQEVDKPGEGHAHPPTADWAVGVVSGRVEVAIVPELGVWRQISHGISAGISGWLWGPRPVARVMGLWLPGRFDTFRPLLVSSVAGYGQERDGQIDLFLGPGISVDFYDGFSISFSLGPRYRLSCQADAAYACRRWGQEAVSMFRKSF